MNNKFNILWLDDEFIKEDGSNNIPIPLIKKRFPGLEFETVAFVDYCEEKLKSQEKIYQAVILDANGKYSTTPNQEANKIGFEDLIDLAQKFRIPVYVFSGELSPEKAGDQADLTMHNLVRKGFNENINLFYKANGYSLLLKKIEEDLNSNYHIFYNYPTILDNVLNYGVNKESARDLLLWMEDKSRPFPEYIALRRIIYDEAMDSRLKPFFGRINSIQANFVTEKCMSNWEKAIILFLFKNTINAEVHNWPSNDIHSNEIIAHSFITAMNWYNRFMHNVEQDPNPHNYYTLSASESEKKNNKDKYPYVGIVELDDDGFYHVGDYLLKPKWAKYNLGKKIKVVDECHHGYQKLCKFSKPIE